MKKQVLIILFLLPVFIYPQDEFFEIHDKVTAISVDSIIDDHQRLFPFANEGSISGLTLSGDIVLNSDSSLVRVILIDNNYHEYLIYETFPLLAGAIQLSTEQLCEETTLLNGITPHKLIFEIIDASIHVEEIFIARGSPVKAELKKDLSHQLRINKINRLNQNIQNLGQKWVAGETSISRLTYQQKKNMFGGRVPNFQGFEYYIGGIFVLPEAKREIMTRNSLKSQNSEPPSSKYAKDFSWRNRHGQDWVTPVKNQGICNGCWAFAPTAAAELLVNLYFNRQLDYDLSEQNLISCTGSCISAGKSAIALNYMKDYGIILEDCLPFDATSPDPKCADSCLLPSERITISGWNYDCPFSDWKKEIIRGASMASVESWYHALQVVGYKILEKDDEVFLRKDNSEAMVTITDYDPLIGQTALLCKNSWGSDWGDSGYVYIVGSESDITLRPIYGPIDSRLYDSSDVRCVDMDGDGFFSWGIGPKPSHCPECPAMPDGNDANPCIGPMDEYGNLSCPTPVPETRDTVILDGQMIPNLYVEGSKVRWYTDRWLKKLVHSGNDYNTGITDPGDHTYYVTQTISGCESQASDITLSIWLEIPMPDGHDAFIALNEKPSLKVSGKPGAVFTWYLDSLLTIKLHTGEIYETGKKDTGSYNYYVTQTVCGLESAPDAVILTIYDPPVAIPDQLFFAALIEQGTDKNGDGKISFLEARELRELELAGDKEEKSQSCNSCSGITSLQGIETFTNLESIIINRTMLEDLNLSEQTKLVFLDCSENRLKDLNVSNCGLLESLECQDNELSNLVVRTNTNLSWLHCGNNKLRGLDISKNVALVDIFCQSNSLFHLDLSNNALLRNLNLSNMPGLHEVCVWDSTFLHDEVFVDTLNSPNLRFTTKCSRSSIYADIPDPSFLKYLVDFGIDIDTDGLISLAEAEGRKSLRLWGRVDCDELLDTCYGKGPITSLDGIEAFKNLEFLDCSGHQLSKLDLGDLNHLSHLVCEYNHLTKLNISKNTDLLWLNCDHNQLSSLDLMKNTNLENLSCNNNLLRELNVSKCPKLLDLSCNENLLDGLEIASNENLRILFCEGNQLSHLNLSNNKTLRNLNCNRNILSRLNISKNPELIELDCNFNSLTSLNVSLNTSLKRLSCDGNEISSINLNNIHGLKELSCSSNKLENLNISENRELVRVICKNNYFLRTICVWTVPFPPENTYVDFSGSEQISFITDCATGIIDRGMYEFNVYPNPVTGMLTIENDQKTMIPSKLEIYTISGQLLSCKQIEEPLIQIDFSAWERGIYLLILSSGEDVIVKKIIKL